MISGIAGYLLDLFKESKVVVAVCLGSLLVNVADAATLKLSGHGFGPEVYIVLAIVDMIGVTTWGLVLIVTTLQRIVR